MSTDATWYRIVTFGPAGGSAPKRSPQEAWAAHDSNLRARYGDQASAAEAAHSPRLVEATTRRACAAADISVSSGSCGRGIWRMAG